MSRDDEIIRVTDDHKGQLLALQTLTIALLRAMPPELQAIALAEWDKETEVARTVLLNSAAPDELALAYERYVKALNDLRMQLPKG